MVELFLDNIEFLFSRSHFNQVSICLVLVTSLFLLARNDHDYFTKETRFLLPSIVIVFFYIFFFGGRPIYMYGESNDTTLYTIIYDNIKTGVWTESKYESMFEPLFLKFTLWCTKIFTARGWYILIATIYLAGMYICSIKLLPKHLYISIIFFVTAYSFYGYGGNGIRNGMATSIALVGLAYLSQYITSKKILHIAMGFILIYCSYLTHRTMILLLVTSFASIYLLKNTRINILIWLGAVVLSLMIGDWIKNFIGSTYFESNTYFSNDDNADLFSINGFRWDFILYSSLPIILAFIITLQKKIKDPVYSFLINTYILTNTAWVLINHVAYSNRFAYLSWFMYPIVLAYPLCKIQIVKHQPLLCIAVLLVQLVITIIF